MPADRRDLAERLRRALNDAAQERPQREAIFQTPDGVELEWVLHERQVMHDTVNALRTADGKAPVEVAEIERVERSACGHSDYAAKFAYGCADLVAAD